MNKMYYRNLSLEKFIFDENSFHFLTILIRMIYKILHFKFCINLYRLKYQVKTIFTNDKENYVVQRDL